MWKDAPHHRSSGKCKLKQQRDATTHLLEWSDLQRKCWGGCGATGTLTQGSCECKMQPPLRKTVGWFLAKLNIQQLCFLVFTQGCEKLMFTQNLHTDVYSSFLHNCQNLQITKMSFSRWMNKGAVVLPDNGLVYNTQRKWVPKPWKNMKEPQNAYH